MYLSIGTATAYNGDIGFKNLAQQCFKCKLYTDNLRLLLPTLIVVPIVPDVEKITQENFYFCERYIRETVLLKKDH